MIGLLRFFMVVVAILLVGCETIKKDDGYVDAFGNPAYYKIPLDIKNIRDEQDRHVWARKISCNPIQSRHEVNQLKTCQDGEFIAATEEIDKRTTERLNTGYYVQYNYFMPSRLFSYRDDIELIDIRKVSERDKEIYGLNYFNMATDELKEESYIDLCQAYYIFRDSNLRKSITEIGWIDEKSWNYIEKNKIVPGASIPDVICACGNPRIYKGKINIKESLSGVTYQFVYPERNACNVQYVHATNEVVTSIHYK